MSDYLQKTGKMVLIFNHNNAFDSFGFQMLIVFLLLFIL